MTAPDRVDEQVLADLLDLVPGSSPTQPHPLLEMFLTDTPDLLGSLRMALDAGDLAGARRAAHSLKGASGAFGARRLSALAAEVESACTHDDAATARSLMWNLDVEFEAFRAILFSYL